MKGFHYRTGITKYSTKHFRKKSKMTEMSIAETMKGSSLSWFQGRKKSNESLSKHCTFNEIHQNTKFIFTL